MYIYYKKTWAHNPKLKKKKKIYLFNHLFNEIYTESEMIDGYPLTRKLKSLKLYDGQKYYIFLFRVLGFVKSESTECNDDA